MSPELHNHDGINSPNVDIYNLLPLKIFTDSTGANVVPTIAITGAQVQGGTMYLVKDPNPATVTVGTTSTLKQVYRLYAFIDGDWRDLTYL